MKRMNNSLKQFLLIFISAVASIPVSAQLLWKVTPPVNSPSLYLFGTMHISAGYFLEKNTYIQDAIKNSDVVFTEASLDEASIATQIMKYVFLPEGIRLSDSLSAAEWARLDSALRIFGNPMISAQSLNSCKPMYILVMLQSGLLQQTDSSMKSALENSVDFSVIQFANTQKKNLRYFETAEQQLQFLFNDPPLDMQFRLLKGALAQQKGIDSGLILVEKIADYYHQQKLDTIAMILDYLNHGSRDVQTLYKSLLQARNERWVETIEHFVSIGRNSAFMAVGAGHLVGEEGLISLLRKKGYVVEPVWGP
jgi:uncharacterized protein YbaP (TraB family)